VETRIRRNIIILVVVTFFVLVGMSAGWFFALVRPQREQIALVESDYQKLADQAKTLGTSLREKQKAEDQLKYLQGQLQFFRGGETSRNAIGLYRRLYFGEIEGGSDVNKAARDVAWRAWMNEYHYQFGPALQQELERAEAASQVALTMPAIKVDDPPQMPEAVKAPNNGFLKPMSATNNGTLTLVVTGTFQNILRFLNTINHSSILMVVGNIKLEGYSPTIKATFTVTPYLVAAGPGAKLTATNTPAAAPGGGPPNPEGAPPEGDAAPADGAKDKTNSMGDVVKIKNPRTQAALGQTGF
jgi:hypothetical protein